MTQERFDHLIRNPFDGSKEEDKIILQELKKVNKSPSIKESIRLHIEGEKEVPELDLSVHSVVETTLLSKYIIPPLTDTVMFNDKYLGQVELKKVNLYKTEQEILTTDYNRDSKTFDELNRKSTDTSNNYVKTIKIHGVNKFMKDNRIEIENKVKGIREDVMNGNVKENLGGIRSDEEEKFGVVGEMLLSKIFNGDMSDFTFNKFDILFNKELKVDVKSMHVKFTLDRELGCFDRMFSYFQATQVKEDVVLAPCLINTETDMALIIVNPEKLNGGYIKRNFKPIWENPPGSKLTKEGKVMLNYKLPYRIFDNRVGR